MLELKTTKKQAKELLDIFEQAGIELRDEIDDKLSEFK